MNKTGKAVKSGNAGHGRGRAVSDRKPGRAGKGGKGKKANISRMKARRRVITVLAAMACAAVVILFLLAGLLLPDRDVSYEENRALAQFPSFSGDALLDGSFFQDIDSWMRDQFAGRDGWISLKLHEDLLIGKRDSHGVYIGKDGYLFAEPSDPDPEAIRATVDAINSFASAHSEISTRMMLVPCAAAILPDKLPAYAPVRDQLADINALTELLNVPCLNASGALTAASAQGGQLFYKTDHHWTSCGAYAVFSALGGEMGIADPVAEYSIYPVSVDFRGTLSSQSGSRASRDEIDIYVPNTDVQYYVSYPDSGGISASMYVRSALAEKDQYTVFFGGNHPEVDIRTTADTGRNLLLFKDSFANCFVQFLTPYYDRIIMIDPRYYYDNVQALLSSYSITDMLFLYSANTFVTDTSLADCLESAQ